MATYAPVESYSSRSVWNYPIPDEFFLQPPRHHHGSNSISRSVYIDPQQLNLAVPSPHSPSYSDYPFSAAAETPPPPYEMVFPNEQTSGSQRRRTAPGSFSSHSQRSYNLERTSAHRASRGTSSGPPSYHSSEPPPYHSNGFASYNSSLPTPPLSPSSTIPVSTSAAMHQATPRSVPHSLMPTSKPVTSPPSSSSTSSSSSQRHFCAHPSCLDPDTGKPTRSFSRRADLQRHHTCAHEPPQLFSCPRPNCSRKGEQGFTRLDHLMEHRRGYHHEDIPKRGSRSGDGRRLSSGSSRRPRSTASSSSPRSVY